MTQLLLCFSLGVVIGGVIVAWCGGFAKGARGSKRRARPDHFEDAILDLADPRPAAPSKAEGYIH